MDSNLRSRNESRLGVQACRVETDGGEIGYIGPCPPSGNHRYYMRLFALDQELSLQPGATHDELTQMMEGHILERAELMGTYRKQAERAA